MHVRALIDQGSEASLITERIVQRLKRTRGTSSTHIIGIGGQATSRTRGITSFNVHSHFDCSKPMRIRAHILPKLTNALPTTSPSTTTRPHLQGLELADPEFSITSPIDLILGADIYGQIIEEGVVKDGPQSPTFQPGRHDEVPNSSNSKLTEAEEECESHFRTTHSRDKDGRYIVRLPFKSPPSQLGDSKLKALRMLYCLQRKFRLNPDFKQAYTNFLGEYESLQHLVPVSSSLPEPDVVYHLPHHGVLKESSITTKLRVVFNAMAPHPTTFFTPERSSRLFDVLLFFRLHRYVYSGDIEKFYRQIKVHPEEWKFQLILWLVGNQLTTFELTTNTYGLACAAFLALRAFQQLLIDDDNKYPLALPALTWGRYVDDIVGGADTVDEAKAQIAQIIDLSMAGGFPIQKWNSNHPDVLSDVPPAKRLEALFKPMHENYTVHALGLAWQPSADTFYFTIDMA
ncbi:uncharacterized protein, partial [Atheta coriaria]|uniref:uncharacterized protein n=1 Tax=Dalotia coriaria TaxID=877792 RepID=UPI0031F359F9